MAYISKITPPGSSTTYDLKAAALATTRTLSITGKATGSATFDGTANSTITVTGRGASVGQSGSTTTNPYYKFASLSTSGQYEDNSITFLVSRGYGDASTKMGILTAHFRTNSSKYWESGDFVWLEAASGIDVSNFILAHNASASPTIVELWVKIPDSYAGYHFDVLAEGQRTGRKSAVWTLYNTWTAGSASAITSGYTQITSSLVTLKNPVSGNAATATKATQDSAGQQINTTYIKGLSVSGKTITYTKGDNSIGTITTQDTNTTYSTGTASALGLTKLYTGTGSNTDGSITQSAITTLLNAKEASVNKVTSISSSSTDTQYPSAKAVYTAINNLPSPMVFKGSLGTSGTITSLPTAATTNTGYTYKVITAGTYNSQTADVGDIFISDGSSWILVPSGDEPSGTVTSVNLKSGTGITVSNSGTAITSSGERTISLASGVVTAGSTGGTTGTTSYGGTVSYPKITVDTYGRVTGYTTQSFTLPASDNTDTKVAQGYSTTANNYPLLLSATAGVTSTSSRGNTTSILNNALYANPNTGLLHATTFQGSGASLTNLNASNLSSGTVPSSVLPTAGSSLGGVKTTSTVTSNSGYTACPIISGVPYYKDSNTDVNVTTTANAATTTYLSGSTSSSTTTGTLVKDGAASIVGTSGTTSAVGTTRLILGNSTASGTAGNKQGWVRKYANGAYYLDTATTVTADTTGYDVYRPSTAAVGSSYVPMYATATGALTACSNPSLLVNLASISATSVYQSEPRPGITGTLAIGHGGTGATSASAALTNLGAAPSDIVTVSTTQPTSSTCKIWINA